MTSLSSTNMKAEQDLFDVEIIEHTWITMSGGVRISAKLWLPKGANQKPVPAILEFIPYRKRDAYAMRDHQIHAWFAARGYACIRPDMRGHGDSEGIMEDEYLPLEQQDALEIIDWLSQQPWCDGGVGMTGISWGGIASLQAATHQPPALKAIIPVGASVDRYYDDGAYLVGCYSGQGLGWGATMFGHCIRPPDPAVVGDNWRHLWFSRLENTPMFAEKWMSHQLRDETWIQGSVCEHYERIKTPVLAVSGWNDCWPNTLIRLLENIDAPCRAVSGAWAHVYPHDGGPGPGIGFLQLSLAWWDRWLKGIDNGIEHEPDLLAFIQDSHKPTPLATERPGRWVAEPDWANNNIKSTSFSLAKGKLNQGAPSDAGTVKIKSAVTTGLTSGEYMPIAGIAELPQDQRTDDARSICFDSDPVVEPMELLGTSYAHLQLTSDCNEGLIVARLCDVAPNGESTLISYGLLNLKLREGRENLAPVIAGTAMDVSVRLNDTGWRLAKGHCLRLALSSQMWPMAWPLGQQAELGLNMAASSLEIPLRDIASTTEIEPPFEQPDFAPMETREVIKQGTGARTIHMDIVSGKVTYDAHYDQGLVHLHNINLDYSAKTAQSFAITEGDPLSATAIYEIGYTFKRDAWHVRTESKFIVTCDQDNFFLFGHIAAFEDEEEIFTREWDVTIPRIVY